MALNMKAVTRRIESLQSPMRAVCRDPDHRDEQIASGYHDPVTTHPSAPEAAMSNAVYPITGP